MAANAKDQERAMAFGEEALRADPTADAYDHALARQFAAVRAEERAAIVAYLREWGSPGVDIDADAIENGDHGETGT